jgi:predicted metalloenzyme YecM
MRNINKALTDILNQIDKVDVNINNLELDHIGYQTNSRQDYDNLVLESGKYGKLKKEFEIDGRRVAIFEFIKPLEIKKYKIPAFEIIEPKEGQVCDSSLAHIEFVIDCNFEEFLNKNKGLDWDLSAMNRQQFPKISIKFSNGKSVKFHEKSILSEIL